MPRALTDHDFNEDIARGLARRIPDFEWTPLRALDDFTVPDERVLELARETGGYC